MATAVSEEVPVSDLRGRHPHPARELAGAVTALRAAFAAAPLPLDLAGSAAVRTERTQVLAQLDDYLLPRLAGLDAPALVVVGGPTGAGKSTLVNSVAGQQVTTPGVLRPTTRSPVLVHHPADREWFIGDRILPTLARVDRPTADQRAIQLVASPGVPRGLAVLDAPDFDSIDDGNRQLATRLLAAADLWLFVTSAARYADEVPWQQLSVALERDTAVAVVMNRIPTQDRAAVSPHLAAMLHDRGVTDEEVFFVDQGPVDDEGRLPASYVAEVTAWLETLARDGAARSATVRRTVAGATRRAVAAAAPAADAAALQVEAVGELLTVADAAYAPAFDALRAALADGTLLRGELAARWSELFGLSDVPTFAETLRAVADRGVAAGAGPDVGGDRLAVAVDLALETMVVDHAQRAAERASRQLRATRHGGALLDWSAEDLSRPGRGLASRSRKAIGAVRRRLGDLVADRLGAAGGLHDQRTRTLAAALVVHAVAALADPLEPADPADPADPLGPTDLVQRAREDLARVTTALLAEERDRYLQPVLDWNLAPDAPGRLRTAAHDMARALEHFETSGGNPR
ncbi:GTPase domain-containing protein [Nocardioides sp. SYSU DS0651]|uniref:GTPase domain-containing protein n=1 Tax=Nocardioides sp. SYSU DS0651 TaxID=3415955 RepID=UPI003F4B67CA